MPLFLKEEEVRSLLPMEAALRCVEEVFRHLGSGEAMSCPRARVSFGGTTLHVMPAGIQPANMMGFKAYTSARAGTKFVFMLFDAGSGALLALMEADALGQIRTGAASGVATKLLARPDASRVGIIGTGWQARTQLQAVCAGTKVTHVRAFSRKAERREAFAREMAPVVGVPVEPAVTGEEAVRDADIVITITNAREPVLLGQWLRPGLHINAAGSNHLLRKELDAEAIRRSTLIATDSKEQARIECGELVAAIEQGVTSWDAVQEIGDIVAGKVPGRTSPQDITLFESQGIAAEDVAVAHHVYQEATRRGVGRELAI